MGLYLGQQKIANLGETFTPREIQSVNGKTAVQGNITVFGSDTQVSETDQRTIADALSNVVVDAYTKAETDQISANIIAQIPLSVSQLQNDVGYLSAIASSTTLGGVKPVTKTAQMTTDVGVDANGKLYAAQPDLSQKSKVVFRTWEGN